ncbi:MAG: hypothetical protein ACK414_16605, partial [Gemmobacter sp.]
RLAHAQTLIDAAQAALGALDGEDVSASRLIGQAVHALREQQHIEPGYGTIADVLQQAQAQIDDACRDLQHHAHHTELDPTALAALDERLSRWMGLARRHRCPPQELPQRWQDWQARLRALDEAADLDALRARAERARQAFLAEAQAVSRQRQPAAERLSTAITEAMQG